VPRFTGTLEDSGRGGGHWVVVPFDAKQELGEARPPVAGTVNGTPFRSRLAVYGGVTYLGLTKEVRTAAGIEAGDSVDIVLERDDAPRAVELPAELEAALDRDSEVAEAFASLAFTHRREYATWIAEAKKDETRQRRAAKAIEMLRSGLKHP
jgi:bifunctional DNA-binding transcriptional regulator/antitoxin component of YhaV-PrlF toxin-antitoxin module